jgi:hypothetical protein
MKTNEEEIRNRLKVLHLVFWIFAAMVALVVMGVVAHYDPLPSYGVLLFSIFWCVHLILAVALGSLAGKLGKGGFSVGFAAFITTPILAPISYARVVWWAHKALSRMEQAEKKCDELGINELPKMRAMTSDRL